jgi:hypothetical protein
MFTRRFSDALLAMRSTTRLTGIISIASESDTGSIKSRLLNALTQMGGVEINPLPGFPDLIVDADQSAWQALLETFPELEDSEEIVVHPNDTEFFTQAGED